MADDPIDVPIAPMEARLVEELPEEDGWQFEPKWDGFRAIVVREGDEIRIHSKLGKPLARYFPEVVAQVASLGAPRFVLDGELILPVGEILSFDALQQRLHPAQSRIRRLSEETPAQMMLFDCLSIGDQSYRDRPLCDRRAALETFHREHGGPAMLLSPASTSRTQGQGWLAGSGGALDGVVAKRLDEPYRSGERAMLKVKQHRTADCVVGGFRRVKSGNAVASLLLGLYRADGALDHVGFTSAIADADRAALTAMLEPLAGGDGFSGKAPGGPSRWNNGAASEWVRLRPELVVEVVYDQVTAGRFRHGTRLLRWRPDKAAAQCTTDQLIHELRPRELAELAAEK
ncbi:MAG TPA: ATP-dependent DNA ligase [Sphingomonas sp.]|jgi:ATP-dependent DNA ligase